jgi:hypothetical protein
VKRERGERAGDEGYINRRKHRRLSLDHHTIIPPNRDGQSERAHGPSPIWGKENAGKLRQQHAMARP